MSLSDLANDEILRTDRSDLNLSAIIDPHLQNVIYGLKLDAATEPTLRRNMQQVAAASPIQKTTGANALDGLVKYIPTESITLYIAATAAISSLTATFNWLTPYRLYWGFVVLTPILFILIHIGKRLSQKLRFLPESAKQWPWWKLIASTIAFIVWALAVPPLVTTDAGKIVAAFGALLVSTFLSLIDGVLEPSEASS